ncbi:uncharacterized protein [Amphiura filiformis]|uniref:uncharacterized protein n=1 Tax=Amphiura filiformis TaxID=82378 RepID=UPI003B21E632
METLSCFNPFAGFKLNLKRTKRNRIKPRPPPRQRFHSVTSSTVLSNDEFLIQRVTIERRRNSISDPDCDRFPAEVGGDSIGPPSYNEIVAAFFEPPPSYQQAILSKVSDEDVSLARTEAWVRASGDLVRRRSNDEPVEVQDLPLEIPRRRRAASSPIARVTVPPSDDVATTTTTLNDDTILGTPSNTVDTPVDRTVDRHNNHNVEILNPGSISPGTRRRIRQSWTHCLQWIVQYSIECNFRSTIAHFLSMVTQALHIKKEHGANSSRYPISIGSLSVQIPHTFSRRMWCDLVFAFGFCTSSGIQTDPSRASDYVVVPRGLTREELQRYKQVLTGLIELPYYTVKTAANLSPHETENVVALLSYTVSTQNDVLPLDHTLVRPIWDEHKRPWLLLQSLNYTAEKLKREHNRRSESLLRLPIREMERYKLQLTRTILIAFSEEYTQVL